MGIADLLRRQDGVVARWQLHPDDMLLARREVRGRRWQRVGRCFVAQNGSVTESQRAWIAVLNAGPSAVLAGRSAAAAAGLVGWSDGRIHVLIRRGASTPPRLPGVKVHWTRGEIDAHPVSQPPRLRTPAALLQASTWMRSDRAAMAVLAAGVQQRLVRVGDLEALAARAVDLRRRKLVTLTLGDIAGGAQALSEIDAARICRRAGLPEPSGQSVRLDRQGRRRYLDLDWHPWRLSVEIDGRQHMEIRQWCDDLLRQNEVVIARADVLRFPSLVVRSAGDVFVDQVARALAARGWRPGARAA
jgi:hypothetical protein